MCFYSNINKWYFLAHLLAQSGEIKVKVMCRRRHSKAALPKNGEPMLVRVYQLKQNANELLVGENWV